MLRVMDGQLARDALERFVAGCRASDHAFCRSSVTVLVEPDRQGSWNDQSCDAGYIEALIVLMGSINCMASTGDAKNSACLR